jgi:hypothetical protein
MSKQAWFNVPTTTTWTPAEISSLVGWWDASDSTTLFDALVGGSTPGASGQIYRWEDKSANEMHLSQSDSTKRPLRSVSQFNSLDMAYFQDDWIGGSISSPVGTTISQFHISFVKKIPSTWTASSAWCLSASPRIQSHCPWSNGIVYYDIGGNVAGTNRISYNTLSGSQGSTRIIGFDYKGSTPSSKIYENGVNKVSSSTVVSSVAGDGQAWRIGGFPGYNEHGYMGEVVLFNASLTDDDRQKLEGYFAHKWGLTGSLQSGHPYKDAPP